MCIYICIYIYGSCRAFFDAQEIPTNHKWLINIFLDVIYHCIIGHLNMGDDITNSHLLTCNLYASSPLVAYDLVNSHSLEDHPGDHPMDGRTPGHKRSEGATTYDPMISDDPPI